MSEIFIIKKGYKKTITIRLDDILLTKIDNIAYNAQVSRNQIIIQCIMFALNNLSYNSLNID